MKQLVATVVATVLVLAALQASAAFDINRAITGVYYSKVAYCGHEGIANWTCDACPKFPSMQNVSVHIDTFHDCQAFVGFNPSSNEIVYGFRGTVNLQGWIVDGDFFQVKYGDANCTNCYVHGGLYDGYRRMAAVLLPKLQALVNQHPNADIFVAGHSMGAALAGFGFLDVARKVSNSNGTKRMYNFGCPRLGNQQFVQWADQVLLPHKEHFRNTNFGDPIPHLAPVFFKDLGLGDWLHMPREVFYMNPFSPPQPQYRICNGTVTKEDPTCADSTPWYDMIGFRNHTTYLDIPLGCFLGDVPPPALRDPENPLKMLQPV